MSISSLSDTQKAALDLSRHVAVTAAAGSGKTTVLVQRFLRILESNGFKPEQIVAITFTEEAAARIKQGIRQSVEERIAGADETADRWQMVYPWLSLAKITTIHGFCLSLLREYPLEAGLDPGFSVLSAGEQKLRLLECVCDSLQEFSGRFHPGLEVLLEYISRDSLEPLFIKLIEHRTCFGDLVISDFRGLEKLYRRETASIVARSPAWKQLKSILDEVPDELLERNDSCARRCLAQKELLQRRESLQTGHFLKQFGETFAMLVHPSKPWRESSWYASLREAWDDLRGDLRRYPLDFESCEDEHHFSAALEGVTSLYQEMLEQYQQRKEADAVVDFEDLLIFTARLVANPRVREKLQQRFRFFLVDEFQDTNHVQWEILNRLVGPYTNLFVVGDTQQSIYRFRDADVTVFRQVQRRIAGDGVLVNMAGNYRSISPLVEFNNRLFAHLFEPTRATQDYEALHQEMTSCRNGARSASGGPPIQSFFYNGSDQSDGNETDESKIIATAVQSLAAEGFRYSDIAILLRARTHLKSVEAGLRSAGIPFQTVGGAGFYEQQEIVDLISLLRFLCTPTDSVALAGVLRSPLFNFSDEDLFFISLAPGEDFRQKLQNSASPESSIASEIVEFALECLQEWLSQVHRHTISGFLRQAIADTGYLEILSAASRGPQNVENVRKFLDLVRDFEKGRSRTVWEFLRFIDALLEGESQEAEAAVPADAGDAVKIYTIHGSKGLQFRVVILPQLGVPLSAHRQNGLYFQTIRRGSRAQTFLGMKIWNPDRLFEDLEHPVYKMLQRLDEYRQIAEEKRLLYVALTRASDRLVLIGKRPDEKAPLSYAKWLWECFGEMWRQCRMPHAGEPETVGTVPLERASHRLAPTGESVEPCRGEPVARPSPEKRVWTPTEIALFSRCPYRFYLSQIEALPEVHPFSLQRLGTKETAVGSAIHEILEKPISDPMRLQARMDAWERKQLHLLSAEDLADLRRRVVTHVGRVAAHPFYQRLWRAKHLYSEKPFHIQQGETLITGVIDKLFQEHDGRWVVVDFKTNEITPSEIEERIQEEAYDLQVELYVWAVSKILTEQKVEGFLFFTHTGDVIPMRFSADTAQKCERLITQLPRRIRHSGFPRTEQPAHCYPCGFYQQRLCSGARLMGRPAEQKALW